MPDEPLLDAQVLAELRDSVAGDDAFIADLVATYIDEGESHLRAMDEAAAARDAEAIVRPAHTLKSSSAALGALRLAQIAREIETAGRAGQTDALADRVSDARLAWQQTMTAMVDAGLTG